MPIDVIIVRCKHIIRVGKCRVDIVILGCDRHFLILHIYGQRHDLMIRLLGHIRTDQIVYDLFAAILIQCPVIMICQTDTDKSNIFILGCSGKRHLYAVFIQITLDVGQTVHTDGLPLCLVFREEFAQNFLIVVIKDRITIFKLDTLTIHT